MYKSFYKFTSMPFELNPNPKFLWLGEKYKEGLTAISYGIRKNTGFLSLTGDVGTGKTTLVNALVNSLGDKIIIAKIPDPSLNVLDFFNFTANAFEINQKLDTKGNFLRVLKDFLYEAHADRKRVLLIIDEAQVLSQALLEEVRLLSNIEKENAKLINILFAGQTEFNAILKKNRALRQRVIISYQIQPLTETETKAYIRHRLKIAGSKSDVFSQDAIHEIYVSTKGNPRLINGICDLALLSGYLKKTKTIEPQIIKESALKYEIPDEVEADLAESKVPLTEADHKIVKNRELTAITPLNKKITVKEPLVANRRRIAYAALVLPLIFIAIFGYLYFLAGDNVTVANLKSYFQQSIKRFIASQSDTAPPDPTIDQATTVGSEFGMISSKGDRRQFPVSDTSDNASQLDQVAALRSRLSDLKFQKEAADLQHIRLRSDNDLLRRELREKKGLQDRIAELEGLIAVKDDKLSELEQRIGELENDLASSKEEIAQLKGQLSDDQTNEVGTFPAPNVNKIRIEPQTELNSPESLPEAPSPDAIIDWVLKKKTR